MDGSDIKERFYVFIVLQLSCIKLTIAVHFSMLKVCLVACSTS